MNICSNGKFPKAVKISLSQRFLLNGVVFRLGMEVDHV